MGRLTVEQAIEYWKIFLDEIEELRATPGTDPEEWDEQEKATVAALEALVKQRHYEDLEEQLMESAEIDIDSMIGEFMHYYNLQKENRLIELPCAVGDTVWIVRGNVYEAKVCRIVSHIPAPNDYITLDVVYEHIDFFYNDGRTTKDTALCRYLSDAFLTKEEAEAKMEELKGE